MKYLYTGEFDLNVLDSLDKVIEMLRVADEEYLEDVSITNYKAFG